MPRAGARAHALPDDNGAPGTVILPVHTGGATKCSSAMAELHEEYPPHARRASSAAELRELLRTWEPAGCARYAEMTRVG